MTSPKSEKTPMEEDFPTICEWVRHRAVNSDRLRTELLRALALVSPATPDPRFHPWNCGCKLCRSRYTQAHTA